VFVAAAEIGRALDGFTVIVTKSTVPVGTTDRVRGVLTEVARHPFAVASNPEFRKEGDALGDFLKPPRVVVGADDPRALDLLRELYRPALRTSDRLIAMDVRSAELTKYGSNAMLATRISFMNELALLAEQVGADIDAVRKGIGAPPASPRPVRFTSLAAGRWGAPRAPLCSPRRTSGWAPRVGEGRA
jgi:UDPglucose 6-dehydrogenase